MSHWELCLKVNKFSHEHPEMIALAQDMGCQCMSSKEQLSENLVKVSERGGDRNDPGLRNHFPIIGS